MARDTTHLHAVWAGLSQPDVLARLHVAVAQGLTFSECATRRARYGPNLIGPDAALSWWEALRRSVGLWPGLVLISAALLSAFIGDLKAAVALLVIPGCAAVAGAIQERRALRAMAVLHQLADLRVRVRREEQEHIVPAVDLVPGDIVFLEAGGLVPADGRLLEANDLRVQEALFTGEAEPVEKTTAVMAGLDLPLADQRNMAFMGTAVVAGRGVMVVTATGAHTHLGRAVATLRAGRPSAAPLKRRVDRVGRHLALVGLALAGLLIGLAVLQDIAPAVFLPAAVGLVVVVLPLGWPAVALAATALSARRLLQHQVLLRRLSTAATLGSTTAVCVNDSGALAGDHLIVAAQDLAGGRIELPVSCYRRMPVIRPAEPICLSGDESPSLLFLLMAAALCNDAVLRPDPGRPGHCRASGDPLEAALLAAAGRAGFWKSALDVSLPRVEHLPFGPGHERLTTAHRVTRERDRLKPGATPLDPFLAGELPAEPVFWIAFSRGAVAPVLEVAKQVWTDGRLEPLDETWRARILAAADEMAARGAYPMGVAFRIIEPDLWRDETDVLPVAGPALEQDMVFAGVIGVCVPPKPQAVEAIAACRAAGIRPVLFTADRPPAARVMARTLGLDADGRVLSGLEIGQMKPEKLQAALGSVSICAQMSVEHKLTVVQALQERGDVVAMIGDELADLAVFCRADIAAAPAAGAGVIQDAADLVLLDDRPAMLVAAVAGGRLVQQALRQFARFALAGNIGKAMIVLLMPLLGLPFPFSPLQALYLNLVVDGLLGVGMALAPAGEDAPSRARPGPTGKSLWRRLDLAVIGAGALIGVIGLGVGLVFGLQAIHELHWRTLILTSLVWAQVFRALGLSGLRNLWHDRAWRSQVSSLAGPLAAIVAHLSILYMPFLGRLFDVTRLSAGELGLAALVGSLPLCLGEIRAWVAQHKQA
ncbi:MAG: cation-translocating P-type ATPase [Anaerolineae bacterium]